MLPAFNAMLVYTYGWYVLYSWGDVYWCEPDKGSRRANEFEATMVRGLYNLAPEMFQTDNKKVCHVS